MASKFKIIHHQNGDNLHLKLLGDFDGTAADELINTLMSCEPNHGKVFIHTSSLKSLALDNFVSEINVPYRS